MVVAIETDFLETEREKKTMAYNVSAPKEKLNQLSETKRPRQNFPKLNWWKPTIGKWQIRFMPYNDGNDQPFQEVMYYDAKELTSVRFVAPYQFGLPDPIHDFAMEMKEKQNNGERLSKEQWKLVNKLTAKSYYYAPILVREEADLGVRVTELKAKKVKEIYNILTNEDYCEENCMDVDVGHDFEFNVTPTDKTFTDPKTGKIYPVNELTITIRAKKSKLAPTKDKAEELKTATPNLKEYYLRQCKSAEELKEILETYLSKAEEASKLFGEPKDDMGTDHISEKLDDAKIEASLNKEFADLG